MQRSSTGAIAQPATASDFARRHRSPPYLQHQHSRLRLFPFPPRLARIARSVRSSATIPPRPSILPSVRPSTASSDAAPTKWHEASERRALKGACTAASVASVSASSTASLSLLPFASLVHIHMPQCSPRCEHHCVGVRDVNHYFDVINGHQVIPRILGHDRPKELILRRAISAETRI